MPVDPDQSLIYPTLCQQGPFPGIPPYQCCGAAEK